ncbi:MAG TPA: pilus assembly protein TadG [Firmicutes bacterium]|jgi:Flp pilus assembly protein TadG|nr:pilus assembly protein [Bacillota bacterium]HAA38201.1 pilus assembly protein TadG [Bacillota bacterium]
MAKWLKNHRGQAVVEAAVVLPIILLLLLGMVEVGRICNAYLLVTQAARQGARYGAVGASDAEITDRIASAVNPLNPAELTVTITPAGERQSGEDLHLRVSYPLQLITPLAGKVISNPWIVSSSVTMRVE